MNGRIRWGRTFAGVALVGASAVAGGGLADAALSGGGHGPMAHGNVTRTEDAKGTTVDPIAFETKGPAEVVTSHVTIAPGGHTPWHHHPGPHIAVIKSGTVKVYETDCTFKTFTAGQTLFDPGPVSPPHVHIAHNTEATDAVIAITDVRDGTDKRPTVTADPQPNACFTSSANGVGQLGVTRVEDLKATVNDLFKVNVPAGAEAFTGSNLFPPGSKTPWHYHPGPHTVTVKSGTLEVIASGCSVKTYTAGQGFFDPGRTDVPFVHYAINNGSGNAEILTTDLRADDKRLLIPTESQAEVCGTAATGATPAPATSLPRTS